MKKIVESSHGYSVKSKQEQKEEGSGAQQENKNRLTFFSFLKNTKLLSKIFWVALLCFFAGYYYYHSNIKFTESNYKIFDVNVDSLEVSVKTGIFFSKKYKLEGIEYFDDFSYDAKKYLEYYAKSSKIFIKDDKCILICDEGNLNCGLVMHGLAKPTNNRYKLALWYAQLSNVGHWNNKSEK